MGRNLEKQMNYYVYNDPEYGEDIEHICYPSLINILTEILDRLETLENKWSKHEEKQKRLSQVAKSVSINMKEVQQDINNTLKDLKND